MCSVLVRSVEIVFSIRSTYAPHRVCMCMPRQASLPLDHNFFNFSIS